MKNIRYTKILGTLVILMATVFSLLGMKSNQQALVDQDLITTCKQMRILISDAYKSKDDQSIVLYINTFNSVYPKIANKEALKKEREWIDKIIKGTKDNFVFVISVNGMKPDDQNFRYSLPIKL